METSDKPSLVQRLARLWDPHQLRRWVRAHHDHPGLRGMAVRQVEIFVLTARSVLKEEITLRAAALTYHTVLSIVPLLAVGFALFKAFGGLQKLEGPLRELVIENLAVGRAEEVGHWLETFISNISAGAIAGFGVLILFYTAVGLLTNIESTINRIWGINRGRPLLIRFAIYWCLITLAPPILGFSVSFTAQLQTSSFASMVLSWLPFGLGKWLLSLSSTLGVCLAFTVTYLIVPSTKVKLKAALLGGIVGGVLWSITKYAYIMTSASSIKYSAIYGALGALPLLMIWIYLSWLIVLFGATFAFANQTAGSDNQDPSSFELNQGLREQLALRLTVAVAAAFRAGQGALGVEQLVELSGAPRPVVQQTLEALTTHGILVETGGESEPGYLPARDLQELTPADVLEALRHKGGIRLRLGEDAALQEVRALLLEADEAGRQVLSRTTLRALALSGKQDS